MKIGIILILVVFFTFNNKQEKDCSEAHSSADDAYSYCKKAYDSDSWADSKSYLKKAMNGFEEAMNYSEECECDDSQSSADDGYTYAKKGYNSSDWDETKSYAKKAKSSADDTMSYAEDCDNKN